jgi:pyruvate dehydrogenase E2 component (dihydrolipoamide acetyltransferase)
MKLISRNVDLGPALQLSSWRKLALGTWRTVGDPSVYATFDLEVDHALLWLEELKLKTGQKITLTHFVAKAMAVVFERHPEINCVLRWGKLYPRKNVDIFLQVANDASGKDLSGAIIRNASKKSVSDIAKELEDQVQSIRKKGDPQFKNLKKKMSWVPGLLMRPILDLTSFLMYTLNIWTPFLGSPKDPFGTAMITNVGSLGLEMAFAPLVPYSRVPFLLSVGGLKEVPVVRDGKIVIRKIVVLCATIDHRLMDGVHGSLMARTLKKICEDPRKEFGE